MDHKSYVYVGITPSQAKPNTQLLSIPAARQTTPPSQVGLAQPKQARTNTQQAHEQQDPQAVLALTNPRQQTGSERQLPPPARAASKPLPTPSSEALSQQFAQNKSISAQQTPRKRTHSLKNQNKLQHSQRAAQPKRQRAAVSELPQPAQPSPAITPLLPLVTQPKSLADKTPQGIADQVLLAQGGQHVRFIHQDGQWQAIVSERPGGPFKELPVGCQRHGDVAKALAALQAKPAQYVQRRIHVLPGQGHHPPMVYIGEQGLKGGMDRAGEASGSGDPQGEPATGRQEGASGSGQLQKLKDRIEQGDITSTEDLVEALNDLCQTPEKQDPLQWIREKYVDWFVKEPIEILTPAAIQEYTSLARIKADTPGHKQLLESYFNSLCNKIKDSPYGETPLIEALEYTLQIMDSDVFEGDPSQLIRLGKNLLAKLNVQDNQFTKATYPTKRSILYALHQVLVLIQRINPSQWDEGLYKPFASDVKDINGSNHYYPVCYHALLIDQSLKQLRSLEYLKRLRQERIVSGLKAGWTLFQFAVSVAALKPDIGAIGDFFESFQAVLKLEGIEKRSWYDWYQVVGGVINSLGDMKDVIGEFIEKRMTLEEGLKAYFEYNTKTKEKKSGHVPHQAMKCASILGLKSDEEHSTKEEEEEEFKNSTFEKGFKKVKKFLKSRQGTEDERKALCFGIVQQLCMLARRSKSSGMRKESMERLSELADKKEWGGDPDIMKALLDGLAEIAAHTQVAEEKKQAEEHLGKLTESLQNIV